MFQTTRGAGMMSYYMSYNCEVPCPIHGRRGQISSISLSSHISELYGGGIIESLIGLSGKKCKKP